MFNRLFTENIGPKILALFLAAGIWLYVFSGESRIITFPSSIPIKPRFISEGLVAKMSSRNIQIKIITANSVLQNLSEESFNAYVDLSGKKKGTYTDLPVVVSSSVSNVEIKSFTPSSITVTLDPAIHKTVPVAVRVQGEAGEGLVAGEASIAPDTVEVSGAESDITLILEATAVVKLNGETTEVKKSVSLQGFNAKGEEIGDLNFSPPEVNVSLPIIKAGKSKTVGVKVIFEGTPKSGFWLSQITSNPSAISITGNGDNLLTTKYIETNPIKIDGLSETTNLETTLNVPEGIVLVENVDKVTVTVNFSAIDSTIEVEAGLNATGLSPSLKFTQLGEDPIDVMVSGPSDLLDSLNSNDVIVNLDLSTFRTPGTYTLDITRDMIETPENIATVRYVPSSITIKLSNK